MITTDGPQVIEFNARFGDPETQVVLPRLHSDLLELCAAVADGALDRVAPPIWSDEATCGVVVASGGYPGAYATGFPITGLDALDPDIIAFHAGTARDARWPTRDDRRTRADTGRARSHRRRSAGARLRQHGACHLRGRALA